MSTNQIRTLPPGSTITFLKTKQLTVQGVVDDCFSATDQNGVEYSWMLTGLNDIPEIT